MKVFQIHAFYRDRGGECVVVEEERKLLRERGVQVVPFYRDNSEVRGKDILIGLSKLWAGGSPRSVLADLESLVAREQPDVAHVHNVFPFIGPGIYRRLNELGVPVVQTVHNFRFLCPNGLYFTAGRICEACRPPDFSNAIRGKCVRANLLMSAIYARAIRKMWLDGVPARGIAKYVALNGFYAKKLVQAGVPEEKVMVIGNFVSEIAERPVRKDGYLLFIGRLSREKGVETLLKAFARVRTGVLRIAGDGPMRARLLALVEENGLGERVEFLGYVSGKEKEALVRRARCIVVPSECYENFPMSAIEAWAQGTPVIGTDLGGLGELVSRSRAGLSFPRGDVPALAECMDRVFRDDRLVMDMGCAGIDFVRRHYSPQRHYEDILRVYESALGADETRELKGSTR